jgi:hypothetical protein
MKKRLVGRLVVATCCLMVQAGCQRYGGCVAPIKGPVEVVFYEGSTAQAIQSVQAVEFGTFFIVLRKIDGTGEIRAFPSGRDARITWRRSSGSP